MNFKKIIFVVALVLFISVSGFSQSSIGIIGSYGVFMPSSWSVGVMTELSGFRLGISLGEATVTFEKENPYSSKHKLTEYWQKSLYLDFIFGYVFQIGLSNVLGLRLGGDMIFSISPAYDDYYDSYSSTLGIFNWAFT